MVQTFGKNMNAVVVIAAAIAWTSCTNMSLLRNTSVLDVSLAVDARNGQTFDLEKKVHDINPDFNNFQFDSPIGEGELFSFGGKYYFITGAEGSGATSIFYRATDDATGQPARGTITIVVTDPGYVADIVVPAGNYNFNQINAILSSASDVNGDGKTVVQFADGVTANRAPNELAITVPAVTTGEFVLYAAPGDLAQFRNAEDSYFGYAQTSIIYADTVENFSVVGLTLTIDPPPSGLGATVMGGAIYLANSRANVISGNHITVNAGFDVHGIYLHVNSMASNVSNNSITITSNAFSPANGIYLHGSSSATHVANNNITVNSSGGHGIHVIANGLLQFQIGNTITTHGNQGSALWYAGNALVGIISDLEVTVDGTNSPAISLGHNTTIAAFRNSTIRVAGNGSKGLLIYPGTLYPSGFQEINNVEFQHSDGAAASGISMSPPSNGYSYGMVPSNFTALRLCEMPGASLWSPYLDTTATVYFTGADMTLGGACTH